MPYEKKHLPVPVWIGIGIMLGIILKLFVIDFLHVSGISMEGTIHNGSVILVNKLAYGLVKPGSSKLLFQWSEPRTGDIVIYLYDNKIVVKRCVAVGGTHLDYLSGSEYSLRVDGKKIILTEEQYHHLKNTVSVPDGYILAIGDNYAQSVDSRTYGFVPVNNILGKVLCR